jgi:hypothetical protein
MVGVRIASFLALISSFGASCGRVPTPAPRAVDPAPRLGLVGCAPATPLPRTATDLGPAPRSEGPRAFGGVDHAALARQRSQLAAPPRGAPSVIAGTPKVSGALDRAVVERLVRSHLPQLRACYERALAADPEMTGTVTVTFLAAPDGRVTTTNVVGSGVAPSVSACVALVVQALPFPAGQPLSVSYPFEFVLGGTPGEPPGPLTAVGRRDAPWTPFALADEPPAASASRVARATEGAIRLDLGAIAACFSGPAPVGSLRAMLAVRGDGSVDSARAGGLGDVAEACVARRLAQLRVASPVHDGVEVACDLARGEARPWRVAPLAGYTVVEAGPRGVRHGDQLLTPGALAPRPLPAGHTFLVVATPDATGAMLELALEWTQQGDATLIALRDGPGSPLVIGAARTAHQIGGTEPVTAWPALRLGGGAVTVCVDRTSQRAAIADPVAVDALLRRVATRCKTLRCSASLGVTIDGDATASQLFDVASAARHTGFQRVLLGSYASCQPVKPARP